MLAYNIETPILFLVFNRPDTTRQIFSQIQKMKPRRLYLAADGPRSSEEKAICEEVRKIASCINWDCHVQTLFRDGNLGCGKAVSQAITWFFENEPEGIVLEDDCLPADSFFGFCSAMLEKYRNDDRIGHVAGSNFQKGIIRGDGSYYFSNPTHVWGWAGWRRAWEGFDMGMPTYPLFEKMNRLERMPSHGPFKENWRHYLNVHHAGANAWGYPYSYHNFINSRLSIIPNVNLITNIGCSKDASPTHYIKNHPFDGIPLGEVETVTHPSFVMADVEADLYSQSLEYGKPLPLSTNAECLFLKEKLVALSGSCGEQLKIPKIIHQIYEDPDIPECLLEIAETWKQHHPGWEYRFWNKPAIERFMESVCPEYVSRYNAFPFDVQRWDAIRYLILYYQGGLYADIDYECLEPLDALLYGSSCCMGLEPPANAIRYNMPYIVGNALMASIPGHSYFEQIIRDVFNENNISVPENKNKAMHIIKTTGPFMTTRIYDACPSKEEVTLLPAELIAPLTLAEVQQIFDGYETEELEAKLEKSFAVHYFFGSWVSQTATKQV
ncbi:MAG: glycosyl transferase [Tannerella sp.]|jgi:hypothetical protein|nr:glycosyl transferase [Tannerella sp.]